MTSNKTCKNVRFYKFLMHLGRGFAHKKINREKLSPTKSQKLFRPSLLKKFLLCFSNFSNFLLMGVWNWNNPTLSGVKLSLFCQFWQQHHVPQIGQCVRCLGTIIGLAGKSRRLDLGDAMIEVGTKRFFCLICPHQLMCHKPLRKWNCEEDF